VIPFSEPVGGPTGAAGFGTVLRTNSDTFTVTVTGCFTGAASVTGSTGAASVTGAKIVALLGITAHLRMAFGNYL